MENTSIEWADNTINFYVGCSKVSEGCANCYMFRMEKRFGRDPTTVRKTKWDAIERNLKKWKPSKIFVNSMSDTFHESLSDEDIQSMFLMMEKYPQHQYLVLTKRIKRAEEFFNKYYVIVPKHIWIGTSVESQSTVDRIDILREIKAKIKFVSFEPVLGYINLRNSRNELDTPFDWAIVGGESGYNPRLPEKEVMEHIIYELRAAHVPTFFKQWGGSTKCKCHNAWGCRLFDGDTLDAMPFWSCQ